MGWSLPPKVRRRCGDSWWPSSSARSVVVFSMYGSSGRAAAQCRSLRRRLPVRNPGYCLGQALAARSVPCRKNYFPPTTTSTSPTVRPKLLVRAGAAPMARHRTPHRGAATACTGSSMARTRECGNGARLGLPETPRRARSTMLTGDRKDARLPAGRPPRRQAAPHHAGNRHRRSLQGRCRRRDCYGLVS